MYDIVNKTKSIILYNFKYCLIVIIEIIITVIMIIVISVIIV